MKTKVLIVDDLKIARESAGHVLRTDGYEVIAAENGLEALERLHEGDCQLVVSDWQMPQLNGVELCRAIRESDFRRYIYFILLTSNDRQRDVVEGLAAGADDYVAKPFHPAELKMRVAAGRRIIGLETRDMAIFAMARLAESRDPETGEHLERVRGYCLLLANQLRTHPLFSDRIEGEYVRLLFETSPLHDIGKVAVPDAILLKPGELTAEEFQVMKQHTLQGAETLQAALDLYPTARFLRMARDIAVSHHERYDGSGYPYGLAGEDIPLCGRIVAVADVYDALTSKRVYKTSMAHEDAVAIITNDRATHFDPDVVDAFLAVEDEIRQISMQWQDKTANDIAQEQSRTEIELEPNGHQL